MDWLLIQQILGTTVMYLARTYMVNGTVSKEKVLIWLFSQSYALFHYAYNSSSHFPYNTDQIIFLDHMVSTAFFYTVVAFWSAWFLRNHTVTLSIEVKIMEKLVCFINSLFFYIGGYILIDICNTILFDNYFPILRILQENSIADLFGTIKEYEKKYDIHLDIENANDNLKETEKNKEISRKYISTILIGLTIIFTIAFWSGD